MNIYFANKYIKREILWRTVEQFHQEYQVNGCFRYFIERNKIGHVSIYCLYAIKEEKTTKICSSKSKKSLRHIVELLETKAFKVRLNQINKYAEFKDWQDKDEDCFLKQTTEASYSIFRLPGSMTYSLQVKSSAGFNMSNVRLDNIATDELAKAIAEAMYIAETELAKEAVMV